MLNNKSAKLVSLDRGGQMLDYMAEEYADDGANDSELDRMIASMKLILASYEITDRQKECLKRRYMDGDRVNDIAADLGVSASTVSKHIKKARARIMEIMSFLFPRARGVNTRKLTRKIRTRGAGELGELTILGLTTGAQK